MSSEKFLFSNTDFPLEHGVLFFSFKGVFFFILPQKWVFLPISKKQIFRNFAA